MGERQGQIHQPEPRELAIESGRVSPRGEKKKTGTVIRKMGLDTEQARKTEVLYFHLNFRNGCLCRLVI